MDYADITHALHSADSGGADSLSDAARLLHAAVGRDALTERSRRIWSAGDYDRISAGFREEARTFVER